MLTTTPLKKIYKSDEVTDSNRDKNTVCTFHDFTLRGHCLTAELQQTAEVAEVFDFPEHGKALL